MLVLSVPGPAQPATTASGVSGDAAANGAPHIGAGLQSTLMVHGAFPSPASQFVRDLIARLQHAGTAMLDRHALLGHKHSSCACSLTM